VASGVIALLKQPKRKTAATLAIGSLSFRCCFRWRRLDMWWWDGRMELHTVRARGVNFTWIQFGTTNVDLGWVLDPLSAVMLVMVTFVGLLIFIYSVGYMAHDENFTRFFCFLSLVCGSDAGRGDCEQLLLLFMCWELVGLTSYLLIGFWYQKPSAAAAAKKAFLTTRVGDVFFLLGIVWLFAQTARCCSTTRRGLDGGAALLAGCWRNMRLGTDGGGCDWPADFCRSGGQERTVSAACVAAGCDGRPDAGLRADSRGDDGGGGRLSDCARVSADAGGCADCTAGWLDYDGSDGGHLGGRVYGGVCALIAVAQNDIKRILAYSTVSQLGYMMAGPGDGRRGGGHVPPDHARVLQGAAVHGRGLGDSRLPRGAGHTADGRLKSDMP
jgi:NADH-quinone oxidoreductase subunit L